jgi:hypothetical protein
VDAVPAAGNNSARGSTRAKRTCRPIATVGDLLVDSSRISMWQVPMANTSFCVYFDDDALRGGDEGPESSVGMPLSRGS